MQTIVPQPAVQAQPLPQPVFQYLPLFCPDCGDTLSDEVSRHNHYLVCDSPSCFFEQKVFALCTQTVRV